ncbi:MAG: LamG domain-containing protein [Candidatus Poribacteria bacterium]
MNAIKARDAIICVSLIAMGLLFIATRGYAEIEPKSIAAAWLFDEGKGNTAKDFSGNGKDGDIKGGVNWVDGKFGKALELNGKDAWVHVPSIGTFDEVTIAEWVNSTGRVGQWRVIINDDGWSTGMIHHQLHPNNKVEFSIHSNPGGNDTFGTFLFDASQLNKWHHLATAYNKEGWIRFYVDGKLDIENKWGGNPGIIGPARIGSWDGGGREWQGFFDELIIFNVALSEDDIQSLMTNGLIKELNVEPSGKLSTTWGSVKDRY